MRKGFTLIEIVISLAILAIGLVGILSLFPIGFDSARRSVNSTQVAIYGHEKLERIRNAGFSAIVDSEEGSFADPAYKWYQKVSTVDSAGAGALKQVDLTVKWIYRNKDYKQVFTTYVATR